MERVTTPAGLHRALPVPDGLEGQRVDQALARLFGLSRTAAADLADAGNVVVDGRGRGKGGRRSGGGGRRGGGPAAGAAGGGGRAARPPGGPGPPGGGGGTARCHRPRGGGWS